MSHHRCNHHAVFIRFSSYEQIMGYAEWDHNCAFVQKKGIVLFDVFLSDCWQWPTAGSDWHKTWAFDDCILFYDSITLVVTETDHLHCIMWWAHTHVKLSPLVIIMSNSNEFWNFTTNRYSLNAIYLVTPVKKNQSSIGYHWTQDTVVAGTGQVTKEETERPILQMFCQNCYPSSGATKDFFCDHCMYWLWSMLIVLHFVILFTSWACIACNLSTSRFWIQTSCHFMPSW